MIDPVHYTLKLSVLRLKWHVGRVDSGIDIGVRHTHLVTHTDAMKASLNLHHLEGLFAFVGRRNHEIKDSTQQCSRLEGSICTTYCDYSFDHGGSFDFPIHRQFVGRSAK